MGVCACVCKSVCACVCLFVRVRVRVRVCHDCLPHPIPSQLKVPIREETSTCGEGGCSVLCCENVLCCAV